ncbi:MAG: OmpA family protein [Pseudomonadota bacterium]
MPEASNLRFQSVKNVTVIESSKIAQISGSIEDDGSAQVQIALESVDTGIDLRNVRMRFLFFETYKYPVATVSLKIDPAALRDLELVRRLPVRVAYMLDLHGVVRELTAEIVVTLIADGLVSVSSTTPIPIAAADFDLTEGVARLEEAANVSIIPAGSVSFDFIFKRDAAATPDLVAATDVPGTVVPRAVENTQVAVDGTPAPAPASTPASAPATQRSEQRAALEPDALDATACETRFDALSRTGAVYFAPGSAELDLESEPLLTTVADIAARCPGLRIMVAGHTDSVGSAQLNQRLSRARAQAVADWLVGAGIEAQRIVARGFGEDRPVVPNTTRRNRALNRRIEFSVLASG